MRSPLLSLCLLLAPFAAAHAGPWDALSHHSVSRSHQFIVYSEDPAACGSVAMAADDTKDALLKLLDTKDSWSRPIIIQVSPLDPTDPATVPSDVRIVNTPDGFKVVLNVVVGPDPAAAHFPQQLLRALLLEYAYRDQPALVAPGVSYPEPPVWLIDGLNTLVTNPDPAAGAGLFRSLIQSGKTPSLGAFLSEKPANLDTPSRTLYSACSMSLVRLLLSLPNGPHLLQSYIRHLPDPTADPEAELLKSFPPLDSGGQSLEKWWTLGLASLAAADRYQGLSLAETSAQLDDTLILNLPIDKAGHTKSFTLDQYPDFQKNPAASATLDTLSLRLLGLEAQASPLMRDVIAAYQTLVVQLAHHQSAHLKSRLASIADYRKRLADHMNDIADYLNWYEATQSTQPSGSFDDYIRTANQLDQPSAAPPRTDPISKYLDSIEQQLAQ